MCRADKHTLTWIVPHFGVRSVLGHLSETFHVHGQKNWRNTSICIIIVKRINTVSDTMLVYESKSYENTGIKKSHSYLSNQWIQIQLFVYKSALNISIVLKTPAVMLKLMDLLTGNVLTGWNRVSPTSFMRGQRSGHVTHVNPSSLLSMTSISYRCLFYSSPINQFSMHVARNTRLHVCFRTDQAVPKFQCPYVAFLLLFIANVGIFCTFRDILEISSDI